MNRGGAAIAAGSDGCVFDGTFTPGGTFTPSADTVTKVYKPARASVANEEVAAMKLVKNATGGEGVVVTADDAPMTIAMIPDDAFPGPAESRGTCEEVKREENVVGISMPRIEGTIMAFTQKPPVDPSAFASIETAVTKLSAAGIVHMDFAARNVFYKTVGGGPMFLLGDFGNTFQINDDDEDFDAKINDYLEKYTLEGKIVECMIGVDAITPMAITLMLMLQALKQGEEKYNIVQEKIRKNVVPSLFEITQSTVIMRTLTAISMKVLNTDVSKIVDTFGETLEGSLLKIVNLFVPEGRTFDVAERFKGTIRTVLKRQLLSSDKRLLAMMKLKYTVREVGETDDPEKAATIEAMTSLYTTWFAQALPAKTGGASKEDTDLLVYESLEAAIGAVDVESIRKDPSDKVKRRETLATVSYTDLEGLDVKPAGGAKKRKTRRKRVKMSRRK
jgi:hypothetical protein